MADRRLRYQVDVEGNAIGNLDKLGRKSSQVARSMKDDLDSTASKGKQLAQILGRMADDIESDLEGSKRAADALGRALGDDLAGDADEIVASFNRAGLSFEEIEQDAEDLAAAFKRIEDVSQQMGGGIRRGADQAADGIDRVTSSSDQSRSVLANMAGNTAQDMGELGGVVGSLGVGIGQLAEYAVDGNIALKNLAAVAGPLALLSAAGLSLNAVMAENTKRIQRAREVQEGYLEALEDTENAMAVTSETAENFLESDIIERAARLGANIDNLADAVTDASIDFETINGPMRDFLFETAEGMVSVEELARAMEQFGVAASPLTEELMRLAAAGELDVGTMRDLTREIGELSTGYRNAQGDVEKREAIERALGIAIEETATAATQAAPNLDVFASATGRASEQADAAADALGRANDELDDLLDISDSLPVIEDNLAQALRNAAEQAVGLAEGEASAEDRYSAFLDVISGGAGQLDDYIRQLMESGVSAEDAAAQANGYLDQLFDLAVQFGLSREQAEELRRQLGLDYPTVTARVETVGAAEAEAWLAAVTARLAEIAEMQAIIHARNLAFAAGSPGFSFEQLNSRPGDVFHTGGVVPGPYGADRLVTLAGGETVRTPAQERQLQAGGVSVHLEVHGNADRDALGDAIWDLKHALANMTTRGDG